MSDSSLKYTHKRTGKIITNNYLKREVRKAERRIKKSKGTVTTGKILAEQTLGFGQICMK